MRGSGLHHSTGSSSPNHGKMPRRYASISRAGDRSPPAASSPLGSVSAQSTGGKGSWVWRNGIIDEAPQCLQCIRFCRRLVTPPSKHPRKSDGDARLVPRRWCDPLEPELEDVHRLDGADRTETVDRVAPHPPIEL